MVYATGGFRLIVRPLRGNHCYIEPGCFIEGAGSLYVGQCWKGSRPVASEHQADARS